MYVWDNPPSMSMLEGGNVIGQRTTMVSSIFNGWRFEDVWLDE